MKIELIYNIQNKDIPKFELTLDRSIEQDLMSSLIHLNQIDLKKFKNKLQKKSNKNLLLLLRHYFALEEDNKILSAIKKVFTFNKNVTNEELLSFIKLSINDYTLTACQNNTTFKNSCNNIFDILSIQVLEILDKIYNTSPELDNYKCINKKLWKNYTEHNVFEFEDNNGIIFKKRLLTLYQPDTIDAEEIHYLDIVNNEEDLLYAFLGMLFSYKYLNPIIKKCKNCKHFFICTKTNTLYCDTCKKNRNNKSKQKFQNQLIHELEKKIMDLYKNDTKNRERLITFNQEYKQKRKELNGANYLYWLVEHYKSKNKQQEYKLKIDTYINNNPSFEEDFKNMYH